jgi:hypothetical protein
LKLLIQSPMFHLAMDTFIINHFMLKIVKEAVFLRHWIKVTCFKIYIYSVANLFTLKIKILDKCS